MLTGSPEEYTISSGNITTNSSHLAMKRTEAVITEKTRKKYVELTEKPTDNRFEKFKNLFREENEVLAKKPEKSTVVKVFGSWKILDNSKENETNESKKSLNTIEKNLLNKMNNTINVITSQKRTNKFRNKLPVNKFRKLFTNPRSNSVSELTKIIPKNLKIYPKRRSL